jgi:AcrR family transcriptional regulator
VSEETGRRSSPTGEALRVAILDAARTSFAEQGVRAPMDEIARRAGVGVATLYRRFPDREALLTAVTADAAGRLAALAEEALEAEPDAWSALARLVRRCTELRLGVLLAELRRPQLLALLDDADVRTRRRQLVAHLERMVTAAQAEGSLRADVGVGDLAAVIGQLIRPVSGLVDEATRERATRRLVELALESLRAGSGSRLPGGVLTTDAIAGVVEDA